MKNNLVKIIFPTRGRINLLEKFLQSIEENTKYKQTIEVIGIADNDDKHTINFLSEKSPQLSFDFKWIVRKKETVLNLPNDYYDLGIKLGNFSYFTWILGNDCEIKTKDWDEYLLKLLACNNFEIKNNIINNLKYYYLIISDDTHWNKDGLIGLAKSRPNHYFDSCCFPLISSNYCIDAKEFYPIEVPTWGADIELKKLVNKSNKFDIIQMNEEIQIEHHCFHNKKVQRDEISKNVEIPYLHNLYYIKSIENEMFEKRKHILIK